MGDSDEEYERRRRDKFRRERNDYERRDERRGGREPWEDRGGRDNWSSRSRDRSRDMYRDYDRGRRDRYSPQRHDMSPPQMKRMRRDWDEGGFGHYDAPYGGHMHGPPGGHHAGGWGPGHGDMPPPQQGHYYGNMQGQRGPDPDYPTQPPMMTFKQFLAQQDDNISDEDAIRKYNDYKLDFKRTQINEFFLQHKDEEWFKYKYHPEECGKRRDEARRALRNRAEVFNKLFVMGKVDAVTVDLDKSVELVKLLDAGVILMEGGTEFDLTALDQPDPPPDEGRRSRQNSETQHGERGERDRERGDRGDRERGDRERGERDRDHSRSQQISESDAGGRSVGRDRSDRGDRRESGEGGTIRVTIDRKDRRKRKRDEEKKEEGKQDAGAQEEALEMKISSEQEELKRKSSEFSQQNVDPEADESSGDESDGKGKKKHPRDKTDYRYESGTESDSVSDSGSDSEPGPPGKGPSSVEEDGGPPSLEISHQVDGTVDDTPEEGEEEEEPKEDEEKEEGKEEKKEEEEEAEEGEEEPQPQALHKTSSIFLRNLAPTITKQEVEAMCKRYPGFMRVALQDPQPERRFLRRGWVTFDRTVNIVDICWNLNNIRLRDCEMGAIVNRDLKQRVRPVNGIVAHKQVVKADIKHAARIIQALDAKWKIWEDDEEHEKKDPTKQEQTFGLVSKNPVLKNITDYLVEEGSFEEEELLGQTVDDKPKESNPEVTTERDEALLRVLDRMILYLRIVHSFDFYSAVEYPNEDEMPHRCGIMHARGPTPPNRLTQNDVNDWMSSFEAKVAPYAAVQQELVEEEAVKLGKKDIKAEMEKFVTANTQELAKDKWLCPLSGKKFKGPEFVKKHIFNKHAEKVEEVKKEVVFFNNYLVDPKRPHLPEHPGSKQGGPGGGGGGGGGPPMRHDMYMNPGGAFQGPQQGMGYSQPRGAMGAYQGSRNALSSFMYRGNRTGGRSAAKPGRNGGFNYRQDNFRNNEQRRDRFPGRRDRGRPDPRSIIEYRDLDAPDDIDIF